MIKTTTFWLWRMHFTFPTMILLAQLKFLVFFVVISSLIIKCLWISFRKLQSLFISIFQEQMTTKLQCWWRTVWWLTNFTPPHLLEWSSWTFTHICVSNYFYKFFEFWPKIRLVQHKKSLAIFILFLLFRRYHLVHQHWQKVFFCFRIK